MPPPVAPFPPSASVRPVEPAPIPAPAKPPTAPPGQTDPLIGLVVGDRYKLVERIGSGGMAAVYRAEHELLKKPMAVKVLLPELAVDKEMEARFEREAVAAARLDHPNCVAITDFGRTAQGQLFLVMEYLDGRPLSEIAGYGKRLPWERALELVRQILRGLARAHELGIVHRDLKSSNIMLSTHGARDIAKIIDFGIAKIFDGSGAGPHIETKAGIVFGTADFLAPERLLDKGNADPRSDLYSVGIILYEMVTGTRPFHEEDPYQIVKRAISEPPLAPTKVAPDAEIPRELEATILRALEKDPDQRFSSAREFLTSLDPLGKRSTSTTGYVAGQAPANAPATTGGGASPAYGSAVGSAIHAAQSAQPHPRPARPRAAIWLWGGLGALVLLIIVLAAIFSSAGDGKGSANPYASGVGEKSDTEGEVGRLIEQAGEGATIEERERAFDRLVVLGYYDRVPWVAKLSRDLEQMPSCEKRREVVAQLRNVKDPAAIPALEKARARSGNDCLKAQAEQTIAILKGQAGTVPANPSEEPEIVQDPASGTKKPSTPRKRSSGGGGGGHF